jgi:rhamnosyltransferase
MQPEVKSGPPEPPRVSVIVPTLNPGPDTLRALVAALRAQEGVAVEVVIVDSSSTDGSADLQALADVWISIPQSEFDHGGTRNLAARRASGDVLVFMTQDARPHDASTLSRLVAPVVAGSVQAAYARQVAPASAPLLERIARDLNYPAESAVRRSTTSRAWASERSCCRTWRRP